MTTTTWQHALADASPGQHIAQLYTDAEFLARAVADFAGVGLHGGEGVVIIAIPAHWRALAHRLEQRLFDLAELQRRGQLVVLDAAACRPSAMPDAQAAILALREFVPSAIDSLLEHVRHHYRTAVAPRASTGPGEPGRLTPNNWS